LVIQRKYYKVKKNGGIVKNWQVQCLSFSREQIESAYPGENLKPMIITATVVHDSKGRWIAGYHMKTSLIVRIDREKGIFETRNTIYQLTGKEGADIFPNLGDGILKVFY